MATKKTPVKKVMPVVKKEEEEAVKDYSIYVKDLFNALKNRGYINNEEVTDRLNKFLEE